MAIHIGAVLLSGRVLEGTLGYADDKRRTSVWSLWGIGSTASLSYPPPGRSVIRSQVRNPKVDSDGPQLVSVRTIVRCIA